MSITRFLLVEIFFAERKFLVDAGLDIYKYLLSSDKNENIFSKMNEEGIRVDERIRKIEYFVVYCYY